MANMSYCRFQNTVSDLRDCFDNINDSLSDREFRARNEIIELAKEIAQYDVEDFAECCGECEMELDDCKCDEGEN